MSFAETLERHIAETGCTAKELAEASGLSEATISRYRNAERTPGQGSEAVRNLARGLAALVKGASTKDASEAQDAQALALEFERSLDSALDEAQDVRIPISASLRTLMEELNMNANALARALNFDPSYISRIQSGQRRPADLPRFVDGVAYYVARNYAGKNDAGIANLFGAEVAASSDPAQIEHAVRTYVGTGSIELVKTPALDSFLVALDAFNLNTYLKEVGFDDIKVPSMPFQLPTSKTYEGIDEMKRAELDFLKAAVLSKSTDDVIMFSDMPLGAMSDDAEFVKGIIGGMALLVKKGVRLLMIHDIHRPLDEMIMGLEGWIPLYMTKQVQPYYLEHQTNQVFLHFLRSAGTVAATGEAIAGNQADGRYTVTKSTSDVAYVRRRAKELLAHAKPLMHLYFEGDEELLASALAAHESQAQDVPYPVAEETFDNMEVSVLPGHYALVQKADAPKVDFLIEHPALVNAFAQYQPSLY